MSRHFTQEQMAEGAKAFFQTDLADCPYPDGDERLMWRAGWINTLAAIGMVRVDEGEARDRRDDALITLRVDEDIRAEDLAAWDTDALDDAMQARGYTWDDNGSGWVHEDEDDCGHSWWE